MIRKKIDLGKYVVKIDYNVEENSLDITVLDEAGEIIDVISVTETNDDDPNQFDINLN